MRKLIIEAFVLVCICFGLYIYHNMKLEEHGIKSFRTGVMYAQIMMKESICKDI